MSVSTSPAELAGLVTGLAPLLLGGLLAWTGLAKLLSRNLVQQAADSALVRILNDAARTARALRVLGAVEVVVAAGLLVTPAWPVPAMAAAGLGVGFLGYLGYAKVTAPDSSCGCAGSATGPITWRAFGRAGLVVAAGAAAVGAPDSWWSVAAGQPFGALAVVVLGVAAVAMLSTDLDHLWLLPLRRARLRLLGHPLAGTAGGPVPVVASVELLESSLAWQAAAGLVRSALIDHWDADGWRILRYAGVCDGPAGANPVSVLFAMDARATIDTTVNPAIKVTVLDEQTQQVVPDPPLVLPERQHLPLVT